MNDGNIIPYDLDMNNGQEWVERLSDGIFNSNTARRDERNAILQINH